MGFLKKKQFYIGLFIVIIAFAACIGYYQYSKYYPSTDDAYIKANILNIAPEVSGRIEKIYVNPNEWIKKGTLLFSIDATDYELAVEKAKEKLILEKQNYVLYSKDVNFAKAKVEEAIAAQALSKKTFERLDSLIRKNAIPEKDFDSAISDFTISRAKLKEAEIELEQELENLKTLKIQISIAETELKNAEKELGYTKVYAPINGYISQYNISEGEYLTVGQKIFAMIDSDNWWVEANFKETDLERIKAGDHAEIVLDMYKHKYKGVVESISFGSGDSFSLLPSENATGNWVKVTQRFPVRIKLDNNEKFPLRIGASVNVTVNTVN